MLALAVPASVGAFAPDSAAEAAKCEALGEWSPVNLPAAGSDLAVPCSDADLKAFAETHPAQKTTPGVVGCESKGRVYHVIYAVNTPDGFFDHFVKGAAPTTPQPFDIEGHRAIRSAEKSGDETHALQVVEIDSKRSIMMSVASKLHDDADFSAVVSCFFDTFEFSES